MSEFIGARISLISKSDIRYVGTLVEINSEQSTVSLDNVRSFGTEGRRGGKDEYGPSDAVYDQIVFRGSDVKDLRIEEAVEKKPVPPPMPDDPAIIGVPKPSARQDNAMPQRQPPQQQPPLNFGPQHGHFPPGSGPGPGPGYPPFGGPGPYQNRFGPQGGFPGAPGPFPGPGGFGMPPMPPYGAPPGWFPPGYQQQGPFSPPVPIGPPGQQNQATDQQPQGPKGTSAPTGPPVSQEAKPKVAEADGAAKTTEAKPAAKPPGTTPTPASQPPPPPVDSKPDVAAALAPPPTQPVQSGAIPRAAPTGPRGGRIVPAVPLASPAISKITPHAGPVQPATAATIPPLPQGNANAFQNATQAANAAVAAAMAKLDLGQGKAAPQNRAPTGPLDNLTQKVNEMRADDNIRHGRQPGTGGYANRGARGGRGGRGGHHPKMEVPTTDFDFQSANAKFNKHDLVKEAIASGSPLGETPPVGEIPTNGNAGGAAEGDDVTIPSAGAYNKGSSFFDNISSELKDREEAANRLGREFRTEERRKNMETFGQGSVDGFRGGYRGRGGRGRGRGRGNFAYRGRGAPRGGQEGMPQM